MQTINKNRVSQRFGKKCLSYHQHAGIQKEIAQILASKIISNPDINMHKVLEVGCGTGFLTKEILRQFNPSKYFLNDLSLEMLEVCSQLSYKYFQVFDYLPGDAESIAFPKQVNLLISASTMQWFDDPSCFIQKVSDSLASDSYFAFSTFGPQNFREIKTLTSYSLNYLYRNEWHQLLNDDFEIIESFEWQQSLFFEDGIQVLKHIKQTGVNGLNSHSFDRKSLREFAQAYARLFSKDDGHLGLTYHPMIIIAKKK